MTHKIFECVPLWKNILLLLLLLLLSSIVVSYVTATIKILKSSKKNTAEYTQLVTDNNIIPSNPQQTIYSSFLVFIYILFSYIIADRSKFCWYRKCYVYRLYVYNAVSLKSNVYNLYAFQLFPFDMCLWFNANFLFDLIFFYLFESVCLIHLPSCVRIIILKVFSICVRHNTKITIFHSISLNTMESHESQLSD